MTAARLRSAAVPALAALAALAGSARDAFG